MIFKELNLRVGEVFEGYYIEPEIFEGLNKDNLDLYVVTDKNNIGDIYYKIDVSKFNIEYFKDKMRIFNIDIDNIIKNGDEYFHIDDLRKLFSKKKLMEQLGIDIDTLILDRKIEYNLMNVDLVGKVEMYNNKDNSVMLSLDVDLDLDDYYFTYYLIGMGHFIKGKDDADVYLKYDNNVDILCGILVKKRDVGDSVKVKVDNIYLDGIIVAVNGDEYVIEDISGMEHTVRDIDIIGV